MSIKNLDKKIFSEFEKHRNYFETVKNTSNVIKTLFIQYESVKSKELNQKLIEQLNILIPYLTNDFVISINFYIAFSKLTGEGDLYWYLREYFFDVKKEENNLENWENYNLYVSDFFWEWICIEESIMELNKKPSGVDNILTKECQELLSNVLEFLGDNSDEFYPHWTESRHSNC